MKILVTGAKGFVGKNLVENLKNVRDGKMRIGCLNIEEIYEFDRDDNQEDLRKYSSDCDFVFHLAGVNRPDDPSEFRIGNSDFTGYLIETLIKERNFCSIMFASSIQATLTGRYKNSFYGQSKLDAEEQIFRYGREHNADIFIYRLPNLFGKWSRPNYNSVVATFCDAVANDKQYEVYDRTSELELLYIDDLIYELLSVLGGREHRCDYLGMRRVNNDSGMYCYVPMTHKVTLEKVVNLLKQFKQFPSSLLYLPMPEDSFERKLFSTYLSYLPDNQTIFDLNTITDERGSFTEFFKTVSFGQFSVNIIKPRVTKGQHWHNSKVEIFWVVSGYGVIQERKMGFDEYGLSYPVRSYEVSGQNLKGVFMLPGYTHKITNLSDTENMVVIIWANEIFDRNHPETYYEIV